MREYTLFVTARALEHDLALDPERYAYRDAQAILEDLVLTRLRSGPATLSNEEALDLAEKRVRREQSPLVKYVAMRRQNPEGQETTKNLPRNPGATWNLHSGPDRGVTWHDRKADIVWLCAAGFHRSGQHDDFYPRVVELDAQDLLLPTAQEVRDARAAVLPSPLSELDMTLPELLVQARAVTETEVAHQFGQVADVRIYVEVVVVDGAGLEEAYVGIRLEYPSAVPPGVDVLGYCISAIVPEEVDHMICFADRFPHRPARAGERIFRFPPALH